MARVGDTTFAVLLPGHDASLTERFSDRMQDRLHTALGPATRYLSIDAWWSDLGRAVTPADALYADRAIPTEVAV